MAIFGKHKRELEFVYKNHDIRPIGRAKHVRVTKPAAGKQQATKPISTRPGELRKVPEEKLTLYQEADAQKGAIVIRHLKTGPVISTKVGNTWYSVPSVKFPTKSDNGEIRFRGTDKNGVPITYLATVGPETENKPYMVTLALSKSGKPKVTVASTSEKSKTEPTKSRNVRVEIEPTRLTSDQWKRLFKKPLPAIYHSSYETVTTRKDLPRDFLLYDKKDNTLLRYSRSPEGTAFVDQDTLPTNLSDARKKLVNQLVEPNRPYYIPTKEGDIFVACKHGPSNEIYFGKTEVKHFPKDFSALAETSYVVSNEPGVIRYETEDGKVFKAMDEGIKKGKTYLAGITHNKGSIMYAPIPEDDKALQIPDSSLIEVKVTQIPGGIVIPPGANPEISDAKSIEEIEKMRLDDNRIYFFNIKDPNESKGPGNIVMVIPGGPKGRNRIYTNQRDLKKDQDEELAPQIKRISNGEIEWDDSRKTPAKPIGRDELLEWEDISS